MFIPIEYYRSALINNSHNFSSILHNFNTVARIYTFEACASLIKSYSGQAFKLKKGLEKI